MSSASSLIFGSSSTTTTQTSGAAAAAAGRIGDEVDNEASRIAFRLLKPICVPLVDIQTSIRLYDITPTTCLFSNKPNMETCVSDRRERRSNEWNNDEASREIDKERDECARQITHLHAFDQLITDIIPPNAITAVCDLNHTSPHHLMDRRKVYGWYGMNYKIVFRLYILPFVSNNGISCPIESIINTINITCTKSIIHHFGINTYYRISHVAQMCIVIGE
jgi:hypothetical protein